MLKSCAAEQLAISPLRLWKNMPAWIPCWARQLAVGGSILKLCCRAACNQPIKAVTDMFAWAGVRAGQAIGSGWDCCTGMPQSGQQMLMELVTDMCVRSGVLQVAAWCRGCIEQQCPLTIWWSRRPTQN